MEGRCKSSGEQISENGKSLRNAPTTGPFLPDVGSAITCSEGAARSCQKLPWRDSSVGTPHPYSGSLTAK